MKKSAIVSFTIIWLLLCLYGCSRNTSRHNVNTPQTNIHEPTSPTFNSDSAYSYIEKQVAFGPRVPGSREHRLCGEYLVQKLRQFGALVHQQQATVHTYDNTPLPIRNIIAQFQPHKERRILLFAHWDTRPFADHDPNPSKHHTPILGANDGASGVGVLLEIARIMHENPTKTGIDIIFFDAEDYGEPSFQQNVPTGNWWCLGSQYWANNIHPPKYKAEYGILLDMVGAPNAKFFKEDISMIYAPHIVEKVWSTARKLGYGKYFIDEPGGAITDDHLPINQNAKIPSIDIIHFDPNTPNGFGAYWHTTDDNMKNISKETLKAVGQTITEVIYNEQ